MSYVAMYRKFRPDSFEEVKGQDAVVKTLRNQIANDRIGHAYLFCGTRGTGKTSVAKLFAKAINCLQPVNGNPCNECAVCKAIAAGSSMNVSEIDAASHNGVDNIREIVENVRYSPTEGKYKVYIIDEVHMLSSGAFNALLKTLEEPPSYVIFILATTEVHKLPITIRSRCQRYDFTRISLETIANRLMEVCERESVSIEPQATEYLARLAEGSMRDALSLLERCAAFFYGQHITYERVLDVMGTVELDVFVELLRCIREIDIDGCIRIIDRAVGEGRDLTRFVTDFTWYIRNLMLIREGNSAGGILDVSKEQLALLQEEAGKFGSSLLMYYINVCCELTNQLRNASQKRVIVEMGLIRLCCPKADAAESTALTRVYELEKELEKVQKALASGEFSPKKEEKAVASREPAFVPQALPEDLVAVCENWDMLHKKVSPAGQRMLAQCKVTTNASNQLVLLVSSALDVDYFSREEKLLELKKILAKELGKNIDIVVEYRGAQETEEAVDIVKNVARLKKAAALIVEV